MKAPALGMEVVAGASEEMSPVAWIVVNSWGSGADPAIAAGASGGWVCQSNFSGMKAMGSGVCSV